MLDCWASLSAFYVPIGYHPTFSDSFWQFFTLSDIFRQFLTVFHGFLHFPTFSDIFVHFFTNLCWSAAEAANSWKNEQKCRKMSESGEIREKLSKMSENVGKCEKPSKMSENVGWYPIWCVKCGKWCSTIQQFLFWDLMNKIFFNCRSLPPMRTRTQLVLVLID